MTNISTKALVLQPMIRNMALKMKVKSIFNLYSVRKATMRKIV